MIDGLDELIRKFEAMGGNIESVMTRAVEQQAEVVRGSAIDLCPVNHGELRNSIRTFVIYDGDGVMGEVYTNAPHAVYVEFGTGPVGAENHTGISPNVSPTYRTEPWWFPVDDPADALRYGWHTSETKEGQLLAYTAGQPAQPFMYPAMKQNERRVINGIQSRFRRELEKYCEGGGS